MNRHLAHYLREYAAEGRFDEDQLNQAADRIEFLEGCLTELADWTSTIGSEDPYVNGYDSAREDVADRQARP